MTPTPLLEPGRPKLHLIYGIAHGKREPCECQSYYREAFYERTGLELPGVCESCGNRRSHLRLVEWDGSRI